MDTEAAKMARSRQMPQLKEVISSCRMYHTMSIKWGNAKTENETENERKYTSMCDALSDLVPFVQFTECGKHPWRSVGFSKKPAKSLQLYEK